MKQVDVMRNIMGLNHESSSNKSLSSTDMATCEFHQQQMLNEARNTRLTVTNMLIESTQCGLNQQQMSVDQTIRNQSKQVGT